MSETKQEKQIRQFLEQLGQLESGELGQLKRYAGLSLDQANSAWRLFYRVLPRGVFQPHEPVYFLVATLYARADHTPKGNFGDAARAMRNRKNSQWLDSRMENLLNSRFTELPYHLNQLVAKLEPDGLRINCAQLLKDVLGWTHDSKFVQKRWARAYYRL